MHCFIELTAGAGGHIRIKGRIHNKKGIGYGHELIFENEVDQTYLRGFAKALFADFGKYAEWSNGIEGRSVNKQEMAEDN